MGSKVLICIFMFSRVNLLVMRLIFILLLIGVFNISWAQDSEKIQANFWTQYFIKHQADTVESVGVFVKGNRSDARLFVEENGGLYRGEVKGWQYIRIPGKSLKTLILDERFSYVDYAPYKGVPMNDTMRSNNRINEIHNGVAPLNTGYTGKGVAIGFIDTGIDFLHGDFRDTNDKTRVLHLWDQSLSNNAFTPLDYGYGRHWDASEIDGGLCLNKDQWGHGSTVAGAGSGNGLANGTHKGIATESSIIVVESKLNAADWLATVVDATQYIFEYADLHGLPCAINASVGTYLGSHDGLDPYALFIDSLIAEKPGRLFAASLGNSGDWEDYHLHVDVSSDTNFSWFRNNPSSAFGGAAAFWEIWADTASFNQVNFAVGADKVSPYYSFRGRTDFRTVESNLDILIEDTIWNANNEMIASLVTWAEHRDGQYLFQVLIENPDSSDYNFRFETFGTGSYDCWSIESYGMSKIVDTIPTVLEFEDIANYVSPDSLQSLVSSFQCSPNIISVGNYCNDSGFVNMYGNWIDNQYPRGQLFVSSSKGPNRLGVVKPEITASGHATLSSAPSHRINDYFIEGKDTLLALGGLHMPNGGTSMASPVIAGIGALLLEKCPNMTQLQFIDLITNSAYQDNYTGSMLPDFAWGYGKVDGFAALSNTSFTSTYSGSTSFCEGESTTIEIDPSSPYVFWQDGSTSFSDVFLSSTSTYFVARDEFGCWGDTVYIDIVENLNPETPTISSVGDSLVATNGFANYNWDFNGLPLVSSGVDSVIVVSQNGNYWVTITDGNGCMAISDVFQLQSAGLDNLTNNEIRFYPNPTSGVFYIESDEKLQEMNIYDVTGKQIYNMKEQGFNGNIDLSAHSNGIYTLAVFTDKSSFVQKIILNK